MKSAKLTRPLNQSVVQLESEDRVVEGLRIPPSLDSTYSVNFVLTQEPGKLKPKDLKVAIEKNRAEREARAEEQRKLREQGGGAGVLDLRGILAEELLNSESTLSDPFRRQLREMAFLADVDEVEKQENEKEFRVSEVFLGADLLSETDIARVKREREIARIRAKQTRWRNAHGRQCTARYAPSHTEHKAGPAQRDALALYATLCPAFDVNRNDVWSKRVNTLRRFVSIVSTWIVRNRLESRLAKFMKRLAENNAFSRDEVRAYFERENEANKSSGGSGSGSAGSVEEEEEKARKRQELARLTASSGSGSGSGDTAQGDEKHTRSLASLSLADILLSEKHSSIIQRERNEEILRQAALRVKQGFPEFTPEMCRRNLFPVFDRNSIKFEEERNSSNVAQEFLGVPVRFDDRAFLHLKTKPSFVEREYTELALPIVPLHFGPLYNGDPLEEGVWRRGAFEEQRERESVDRGLSLSQLERLTEKERERETERESDVTLSIVRESERQMRERERERLFALGVEEDLLGLEGEDAHTLEPRFLAMRERDSERERKTERESEKERERPFGGDSYTPYWLHAKDEDSAISLRDALSSPSLSALSQMLSTQQRERVAERESVPRVVWRRRDRDSLTALPTHRDFSLSLRRCESDAHWAATTQRPLDALSQRDEDVFMPDDSLRNVWTTHTTHTVAPLNAPIQPRTPLWSLGGNFSSSNAYLLGETESRWRDGAINPIGPTLLSERYRPDRDRHVSGLSCYRQDHLRGAKEWDPDVAQRQSCAAREDYLTESESDEDDDEDNEREGERESGEGGPQNALSQRVKRMRAKVQRMLRPDPAVALALSGAASPPAKDAKDKKTKDSAKDKEKDKKAAPTKAAPTPTQPTQPAQGGGAAELDNERDREGEGEEYDLATFTGREKRKAEQVELLRDRRVMDLESHWARERERELDAVARRGREISSLSACSLSALPVQLPFHQWADEAYQCVASGRSERETAREMANHFVEIDPRLSLTQLPTNASPTTRESLDSSMLRK